MKWVGVFSRLKPSLHKEVERIAQQRRWSISEVVRVARGSIQSAPGLLEPESAPYFLGVCHYRGRTLILLNANNVATSSESIVPPMFGSAAVGMDVE